MVKDLVWSTPSLRQAIMMGETGPLEVATVDASFTPSEASNHLAALDGVASVLPLGELVVGAFSDDEVSVTFHRKPTGVVVLVSDPKPETLAAHVAELDKLTAGIE